MDFWCGMECKDIRSVCLEFIGLNTKYQILNLSTQQDLWQLFSSHFNCKSYHKILSMSLLYSATHRTFNNSVFFSMIGKNEYNHIFGAYSSIGIPSDNCLTSLWRIASISIKSGYNGNGWRPPLISGYHYDPKSFIFCVQSRLFSKPTIFKGVYRALEPISAHVQLMRSSLGSMI
eukprot:829910_1